MIARAKMISFLKSIHIDNVDDFDMDFEMVGRNRFNSKQIDMVIVKQTPWQYEFLHQLQDGLRTVDYPYYIRFSYIKRPTSEDVASLLKDWYQSIYHIPFPHEISCGSNNIVISYDDENLMDMFYTTIFDFKDFLTFINYEFGVEEKVKPAKPAVEEKVPEVVEETPKVEEVKEEKKVSEEVNNGDQAADLIVKEKEKMAEVVEDVYLQRMKDNLKELQNERERQRLNRRGNYKIIDKIDDIKLESDHVDFVGKFFSREEREFGGKKKETIGVFDEHGGAIYVTQFINASFTEEICNKLSWGDNLRIRGVTTTDNFTKQLTIKGHYVDPLPPDEIENEEGETRVELHLHSNMSAMDGISNMDVYCKLAKAMGHKAIAITDHGVVQGFPDAQAAARKYKLKILYGCEFYMIEDRLKYIMNPCDRILNKSSFVVFDTETTGLSAKYNNVIEFGAVKVEHGTVTNRLDILINPGYPLPRKIVELTHISDDDLAGQPTMEEALPKIMEFIGDAILVTHNAEFDIAMMNAELKRHGYPTLSNPVIDTLALSRYLFPESKAHRLGALCKNMEVEYDEDDAHRADYDAKVLNDVWQPILAKLTKGNYEMRHKDLDNLKITNEHYKHMRPHHVVAIAKDKAGLKDLFKLVSYSHVDYLAEVPKIPRGEIEKHRSHLLIGSACFNGEVFNAGRYYENERLLETMKFYDYIEVQPLENYSWLVNMRENTQEEIKNIVKDIVNGADSLGIPVCATGDVHYADRTRKVFRDVYIFAKLLGGANHALNPYSRSREKEFPNPDQHYRSTKEMLECMSFLGEEKAYEITVTNTNKIADQVEPLEPTPNTHLYTPTIENCDNMLRQMCFDKAHELYGDVLPEYIEKRLNRELDGIINNGYAVIYYIAHKIIKKANEDGFVVGSRGSVGSSFVATMSNITEVNPLPPHYRCPKCKHLEWTSETMPEYKSGYDLPEKVCPICGEPMVHDGQNIPFETFLGFNAEKVPDIDLNFPNDYQGKAHDYTKVLLGETNVFRAGTIETVAEKTAFGYAKGYVERMLISKGFDKMDAKNMADNHPKAKIGFLASGCVDVKRTTGQHPGGIVVVPKENDVYDFTPVQYPADDLESRWQTTHFDFHSIHDTILKLDLLGHVDPLALRLMCELTGVDMKSIPMNDEKVLSLFRSPEALGMSSDYDKNETGALGIPEFGTHFVRGILETTRPRTFADLVIISGISHGTNVWQGNAENIINEGKATLREVIGCRDDIMGYLISKGLPPGTAFKIMEDVRKGKGLKEEYLAMMKANNVPDFYINSCQLIKYLFPKGHAVAYVTMAVRVGYFKVYYPLEFYNVFFSVRSKQYDIKTMIEGKDAIIRKIVELDAKSKSREKLSNKEGEQLKTLHIALEMYQRGYKISNINLYKSDSVNFVVDRENKCLIPPFSTVDQLGENNAQTVVEARKDGPFTSKKDLLRRTKLSQTNVDSLEEMGVLKGLDEDDQLTLF
ncbi:MAG: PolC-type DNA polymerase III [Bacilli bacterium]|nr:PolC-type DNA polymerase III [Bacilli bacterium]